jgi:hypothetical protein
MILQPVYRGFAVPFVTAVIDGVPDFRVTDERKRIDCIQNRLCGLCGGLLEGQYCFMGGESCSQTKIFFDPPMHEECAGYAMAVCPYFALKNHSFADVEAVQKKHEGSDTIIKDMGHQAPKPNRTMILFAGGWTPAVAHNDPLRTLYFRADDVRKIKWFKWNEAGASEYDHIQVF